MGPLGKAQQGRVHVIRLNSEAGGMVEQYQAAHRDLRLSIVGIVNMAVAQWMRDTGAVHIEEQTGKPFDFALPVTVPEVVKLDQMLETLEADLAIARLVRGDFQKSNLAFLPVAVLPSSAVVHADTVS